MLAGGAIAILAAMLVRDVAMGQIPSGVERRRLCPNVTVMQILYLGDGWAAPDGGDFEGLAALNGCASISPW